MTYQTPIAPAPAEAPPAPNITLLPDDALVPVAERHDGWTPQRQRDFIEMLADTGSVTAAARSVGMSEQSARRLRRRSDARAFDAAWEAALERALQQLLPAAIDRALNGTVRQRWYRGELVAEERVYHDGLLLHLMERGRAMLGAEGARRALRENWDLHMEALAAGAREAALPATGPLKPETGKWEVEILKGRWITTAPWPLGEEEDLRIPARDRPLSGHWRYVTEEENEALNRRLAGCGDARDQARRSFFDLR